MKYMHLLRNVPIYIFFGVIAILSLSCNRSIDVDSRIADAESALDDGNYDEATKLCTAIDTHADPDKMTVRQLCRMGMIHAALADKDIDSDANMATAMRFFVKAYEQNADSADMFVEALPIESQPAARIVLHLMRASSPDSLYIPDHEMPDSAYMERDEISLPDGNR